MWTEYLLHFDNINYRLLWPLKLFKIVLIMISKSEYLKQIWFLRWMKCKLCLSLDRIVKSRAIRYGVLLLIEVLSCGSYDIVTYIRMWRFTINNHMAKIRFIREMHVTSGNTSSNKIVRDSYKRHFKRPFVLRFKYLNTIYNTTISHRSQDWQTILHTQYHQTQPVVTEAFSLNLFIYFLYWYFEKDEGV